MGESLGMILSICRPMKKENKLSVSMIKWWNRKRITVIDIPISKGIKWKEYMSKWFKQV